MTFVRENEVEEVLVCSNRNSYYVRVPKTNIDDCILVPPWRSLFAIFAILLAITDIPRTGLAFRLRDYYAQHVAPNTVMHWGPFEYQIAHLQARRGGHNGGNISVNASRAGNAISELAVWPYKHDTLSIAPRAVAQHLAVASYPACILYREECLSPTISTATVFTMLDDLVEAVRLHWFPDEARETRPFIFFAKSNWVDRLSHFLVRSLTKNPENRLHAVYHIPPSGTKQGLSPLHICGLRPPLAIAPQPAFCGHHIRWDCDHPINPTGQRNTPIWDHITLRFNHLQTHNPTLDLDITMLVSTFSEQTHIDRHVLPTVSFTISTLEVTTLIRGRMCDTGMTNCRTVFLDDFRYERSSVESNEEQWEYYLWLLRGSSQLYIWIRVGLLVAGCYHARKAEAAFRRRHFRGKFITICRMILKVPGYSLVYGSWIPIIGYTAAHFLDSSAVHVVLEFRWSSIGGLFDFNPIRYIIDASIQMRTIWMIALIWKCGHLLHSMVLNGRDKLDSQIVGIVALRGGWIGVVSWLATFGFVRSLKFRDSNVVSLTVLPRESPPDIQRAVQVSRNYADKGVRFDLMCSLLSCIVVAATGSFMKITVRILTGRGTSIFACRSFYLPLSAGCVWPMSSLQTLWGVKLHTPTNASQAWPISPGLRGFSINHYKSTKSRSAQSVNQCDICCFPGSLINWRPTQGCVHHEPIFDIHCRTPAIWSLVRLINITNMTEPLVLFRLYVLGKRLFVYKVTADRVPPYLILLPVPPRNIHHHRPPLKDQAKQLETTRPPCKYECVGTVDSRHVPWHVLVQCG